MQKKIHNIFELKILIMSISESIIQNCINYFKMVIQ